MAAAVAEATTASWVAPDFDALGYAYDSIGHLKTITYPGAKDVEYEYDTVGQLTSLTDWLDNEFTFTWTTDGQLDTQTSGNGVVQSRDYDNRGQLTDTEVEGLTASLATFAYGFDAVGQLTSTETTLDGQDVDRAFEYDPLSQLSNVATTVGSTTTAEDYDATSGGLLTEIVGGHQLTYNTAQQLISADAIVGPDIEFAYDSAGRRTSSTSTSYGYDAAGYLATVTTPTTTVDYTTDARGLRQTRTEGTATEDWLWSTVGGLPLLLDDGDHSYIYGPSSTPIAQIDDTGTVEYLHVDLLGSVRLITDDDGDAVSTATFDEFGTRIDHTGPSDSAFGYTGAWTDADTGLVHLRARDYDPATGQFLTVDPAVDQTRQPYAYTGNNPLTRTDPTGLDWLADQLAFWGGYADRTTFGLSSTIAKAAIPGWECFVSSNSSFYGGGQNAVDETRSFFVGMGDGASGWLTEHLREAASPGSTSTINKDGYYWAGAAVGFIGGLVTGGTVLSLAGNVALRGGSLLAITTGNFAQKTASTAFGSGGPLAGHTIETLADGIRNGSMLVDDIPVGVIIRDGNALILNTRSALALTAAGVNRAAWKVVNQTGDAFYEGLLTNQLVRNGLTSAGIPSVLRSAK